MASTEHERLIRVFSALLAPTLIACGPKAGEPGIDDSQFTEDLCRDGQEFPLAQVTPQTPVDYLEERFVYQETYDDPPTYSDPMIRDAVGERCGGATDEAACSDAFAELPLDSQISLCQGECQQDYYSLGFTRGAEVGVLRSAAEVNDFLGPVDSAGDAVLLARYDGYRILCEGDMAGVHPEGFVVRAIEGGCGSDLNELMLLVREDGSIEVIATELIEANDPNVPCAIGRMPAGLRRSMNRSEHRHPVGKFFADVAELEAAAVHAFGALSRELNEHALPRPFVRGAQRGADDEVRHARSTAHIARRYGSRVGAPSIRETPTRSLAAVLADNAAEGCVRETYGALVAHTQAQQARDPLIRRAMIQIARDETRHAALSWELAGWARAHASVAERKQIQRAGAEAWERFAAELTAPVDGSVVRLAGMPGQAEARRMFAGLRDRLH